MGTGNIFESSFRLQVGFFFSVNFSFKDILIHVEILLDDVFSCGNQFQKFATTILKFEEEKCLSNMVMMKKAS